MKLYPNMISRQDEMHLKWQLTVFNSFVIEKEEHMSERLFCIYACYIFVNGTYIYAYMIQQPSRDMPDFKPACFLFCFLWISVFQTTY